MNFANYEILFLQKLIKLNNNQNNRIIKKSSKTSRGFKEVLVGILEVQKNDNSAPFFCFYDGNEYIKCLLLNFNECWLSNVVYTDKWTLIKYNNTIYYLEIHSFSILNENKYLINLYNGRYKENLNVLLNKIEVKPTINKTYNQAIILKEFETKTLPILNQTFISDNFLENFKNGVTIVEIMIEDTSNIRKEDDKFLTSFVIFHMSEIDKIMMQEEKLTKDIFQFNPKKSSIQRCFVQNFENNLTSNILSTCINDLSQDYPIFDFVQTNNINNI
ncbi:hypothetical protein PIROE2DRAFT_6307, partial [Piromyces sp. E2]